MSSSDCGRLTSRRAAGCVIVLALLGLGLAACTVQPLYGTKPGGGAVQRTLTQIEVEEVDNRVAQVVRNKLLFQLTGGAAVSDPVYRMRLSVTDRQTGLGLTSVEASPVYSINVGATYELVRISTGEVVLKGTSKGSASYNRVNQVFANTRARLDAEDRAAGIVGNDIAIRVAAAVAAKDL